MTRWFASLLVTGMLVTGSGQLFAHHSFAATYSTDQSITIEGDLVQVLFRNPHSFLYLATGEKDQDGNLVRWAVEWGGTGQLGTQGVTRETLKVGDHVQITGNPGRNASEHRIRMVSLRRPSDGFAWGIKKNETVD
jgi:hypothetical protein